MHVLFYHQNFPAQFGHIALYLAREHGYRCTFVSEKKPGKDGGVERIQYKLAGGATAKTNYCSRMFENMTWHSQAVYEALRARPDIQPDLVVGHSGFGSTIMLRELYDCPVINYFEYFYHTKNSDLDFRKEYSVAEIDKLRARIRNACLLLDLDNCDVGYSPTVWQRDRFPPLYHSKLRVVFDGVDTRIWQPQPRTPRTAGRFTIPDNVKVITYVARGMESIRGFDIFMKVAKKLCNRRPDIYFVVVGEDRVCYGGDQKHTGNKSFKQWVLAQDNYDLSRFAFLGLVPPPVLAQLFSITDLHIYLTAPFVLSWSLMDALACGTTVLASDTAPVREMIQHDKNGLLIGFFDIDGIVETAIKVLDKPEEYRHLGQTGMEMIKEKYSLDVCLPKMLKLYEEAATMHGAKRSTPVQR
jgi:glycosyltransferase involved in cell wall biosynthesis